MAPTPPRTDSHPPQSDSIITFQIPKPASDEHISLYAEIRLSTLYINPEAFNSVYEYESLLTTSQWHNRVNTPGRTTLLALSWGAGDTVSELYETTEFHPPPTSDLQLPSSTPCLGTLSIISPSLLASGPVFAPYPPEIGNAVSKGTAEVWMLVGMFVRPSARGRGVGKLLIEHALEFIKNAEPEPEPGPGEGDMDELTDIWGEAREEVEDAGEGATKDPKHKDKIALLGVFDHNIAAQKLYTRAGFSRPPMPEDELATDLESLLGVAAGTPKSTAKESKKLIWMMYNIPSSSERGIESAA